MRTIVYIDDFNFYFGVLKNTTYKWLDIVSLVKHICHVQNPQMDVVAVKFFTAPVAVVSMKLDDGKMATLTGQVGQNVNFAVNGQTVRTFLDANKVPYKTGGGFFSHEKSNVDIADEARKWTALVECWK